MENADSTSTSVQGGNSFKLEDSLETEAKQDELDTKEPEEDEDEIRFLIASSISKDSVEPEFIPVPLPPEDAKMETVAQLGGWSAKRVSVTGQIIFQRDADGLRQSERPKALLEEEDDDEDDYDNDDNDNDGLHKQPPPTLNSTPLTTQSTATTIPSKLLPLSPEQVAQIQSLPGNARCCDCGVSQPSWASFGYGVLLCLSCSGYHRNNMVQKTTVKSLTLDNWNQVQIQYMMCGGNDKFKSNATEGRQFSRYKTDLAETYRLKLQQMVEPQTMPPQHRDSKVKFLATPSNSLASSSFKKEAKESPICMICGKEFSVMIRKYFCRSCNRACCVLCAPLLNSKPLPQIGGMKPLRHCSRCYRSPFIDWSQQGLIPEGRKSMSARKSHVKLKPKLSVNSAAEGTGSRGHSSSRNSDVGLIVESGGRRKTMGTSVVDRLMGRS